MQKQISALLQQLHLAPFEWNLLLFTAAILLGLLIKFLLVIYFKFKKKNAAEHSLFYSVVMHLGNPLNVFLPLMLFNLLLALFNLPPYFLKVISRIIEISLIITFAWILFGGIAVVQDFVYRRFDITKSNNLRERKIRTQLQFLKQLTKGLIIVLTVAAVLLTFSTMRKIGTGLLTGVGISGIIIGFAAQRSLSNLLAGFQIAFTQPIRIDDVVLVENEFGWVEEITLTYVVVRIWDERRLVLPINYFIEKPFQNWTRTSSALLGSVFIYTDYTIPIEPLRAELTRLLQNHPLWDKRVNVLQVTNVSEKTMELRVLVSSQNAGEAWDLRCHVRENLLKFINENYAQHLPKTRATMEPENGWSERLANSFSQVPA